MDAATIVEGGRGPDRRNNQRATQAVRFAFRILDRAAPALAARMEARLRCTPPESYVDLCESRLAFN